MVLRQTAGTYWSWKTIIANYNDLVFGRRSEIKDQGHDYWYFDIRRGTIFRKHHYYSGIPGWAIVPIRNHPLYPEGIINILPYQEGSLGWKLFHIIPLQITIKQDQQLRQLQHSLSNIIRDRLWLTSSYEGMEKIFKNFFDIVQRGRSGLNIITSPHGEAMTPPPIFHFGKRKPGEKKPPIGQVPGVTT